MDKEELLLILMKFAESSAKEGQPISRESIISNWPELIKGYAPTKPLSPTQRHAIGASRHIKDACDERDRMARELAGARAAHEAAMNDLRRELNLVIASSRDRLDWLEPNYEGLKRDYDTIKSLNFSSVFMITLGPILIGAASFLPWDVLKFLLLGSGATASIYGLWTQGLIVYKSPVSKDRPEKA